jgi:uncharacterized protein YifE (UPF0438 family)
MSDKEALSRRSLFTRQFTDQTNYPYGFSRSGDFSIQESKALSEYGFLIKALVDGSYTATTPEDHDLLDTATGKKPIDNNNLVQRAWDKYQKRINRKKHISIYGSNKASHLDAQDTMIEEDFDTDV